MALCEWHGQSHALSGAATNRTAIKTVVAAAAEEEEAAVEGRSLSGAYI